MYVFRNVNFREDRVWGPTSIGAIGTLGPVGPVESHGPVGSIAAAATSGGPISSGPISTTSTGPTLMGVEGVLAVLGVAGPRQTSMVLCNLTKCIHARNKMTQVLEYNQFITTVFILIEKAVKR